MNPQRRGILAALLYGPAALLGDTPKQPAAQPTTIELPKGYMLEVRYCGKTVTLTGEEIIEGLRKPQFSEVPMGHFTSR